MGKLLFFPLSPVLPFQVDNLASARQPTITTKILTTIQSTLLLDDWRLPRNI